MQEGVVIFSQKDIEEGLMDDMVGYAADMGLTVPEMVRQVFLRRLANDLAHFALNEDTSKDFKMDKQTAYMVNDWGYKTMLGITMKYIVEEYQQEIGIAGGVQ